MLLLAPEFWLRALMSQYHCYTGEEALSILFQAVTHPLIMEGATGVRANGRRERTRHLPPTAWIFLEIKIKEKKEIRQDDPP
jgi:hypothetical protein